MPEIKIAAKEFAETGSGCMATPLPDSDELFFKVAEIAGWKDIWRSTGSETYFGNRLRTNPSVEQLFSIPRYDRSIDAIWALFEELQLYPSIIRTTIGSSIYCHVSAFPQRSAENQVVANDPNLAIALCKLLIAVSDKID